MYIAHAYGANDDLFQTFKIMRPGCIVRHSFTAVILWLLIRQHGKQKQIIPTQDFSITVNATK